VPDSPLAVFVDRDTMVYERRYPHPIERVFEAVSTAEHLDVWMLPESRVERRLGGSCGFGWGGSADDPGATHGTITEWSPPTTVQYTFEGDTTVKGSSSFMRFDLEALDDASTLLLFTLHFLPGDEEEQPYPGGDLPALGTAWRPGFVAGYHEMLDELGLYLLGQWTAEDRARHLGGGDLAADKTHNHWIDVYRAHIREACPPK